MRNWFKYFDKPAFFTILLLTITGIALIYSASHGIDRPYFLKQSLWLAVSVLVFFVLLRLNTEKVFQSALSIFIILLCMLFFQLLLGRFASGTRSWVKTGIFDIQVSEFIKIPLALILARALTKFPIIGWKEFIRLMVIIGTPFVLIALQPDLGTAFMLLSFFLLCLLLKKIRTIVLIFALIMALGGAFTAWNYVLKPYQKDRLVSFINPEKYQKSTGYQITQSKIAIGSGGIAGKGYLNGTQSQYKFLPTRHTDFIVSVLGEEFGFFGITFIFALFFLLFYRQFNIPQQKTDEEFYFVYLFNFLVFFQFLINILMSIGLFPILGIPLPFVSYGGSSLLSFFVGEALVFRIKINNLLT